MDKRNNAICYFEVISGGICSKEWILVGLLSMATSGVIVLDAAGRERGLEDYKVVFT